MKNLYPGLVVFCLLSFPAIAQETQAVAVKQHIPDKPLLFAKTPDKLECDPGQLQQIFAAAIHDTITVRFSRHFTFKGIVSEKVQQSTELLSVNVQSLNFPGALLNISLLTLPHTTQQIRGRIIHPQRGDVLQLTRENDKYFLVKRSQKFFLAE